MAFLCQHWGYYENADKDMKAYCQRYKEASAITQMPAGKTKKNHQSIPLLFLAGISKPDALQKTREIIIQSNSTSAVCTSIFSISGN